MNQSLQAISIGLPLGSIDTYIQHSNQIPMLSLEEEQALARRFFYDQDLDAARQLVLAHLRYVARIARGYLGYGLPLGDLIQEGNIGLMKAVKRFDPNVGVRLVSFAVHWIKAEIHEYILRNWRIVKIATTKAQRKLFFNLRTMKKRLGWLTSEEVQEVANDLGVSTQEVMRMEQRLNANDSPFDAQDDDEESEGSWTSAVPAHFLEDKSNDPLRLLEGNAAIKEQHGLIGALECLDDRSQDILRQRWLAEKKATLHDLADKYQVSPERIRQLEKNAMVKLRKAMAA